MKEVISSCIYCGCGCKLRYLVENNKVVRILPFKEDQVSEGRICAKGLTINEVINKKRITNPLIREDKGFKEVSWKEAYDFIYENVKGLDNNEILFIPSGKINNEDNYIMQKFARIALKTNNVDGCCNRLCHANTVLALENVYGIKGTPAKMNDVFSRDVMLIIGSNPASNYPMIFSKTILTKRRSNLKVLTVGNYVNETARIADYSLQIRPGTDLVLLNGISNHLIENGGIAEEAEKIEGFNSLKKVLSKYTLERVIDTCNIKKEDFLEFTEVIASSSAFGAMHGMNLAQVKNGYKNIVSLLNLVMLKDGLLLTSRGEVNVQGLGDMGCTPDSFLNSLILKGNVEKVWGTILPDCMGLNMIKALYLKPVKALFACDVNIAVSLPDLNWLHKSLKEMFFVLLHHHENYTMKFANVVLPIPMLIEQEGTITTGERRIRHVRKVVDSPGLAKPVWKIFKELSEYFNAEKYFNYNSEKDIFEEITKIIPAYRNVDPDKVYRDIDGWPDKTIKFKKFIPVEYKGAECAITKKYPFVLITVRSPLHFLHDELTSLSKMLRNKPSYSECCFINPKDAKFKGISDGDEVLLKTHAGEIKAKVKFDSRIPRRVLKLYIHSQRLLINKLIPLEFTPETFTPNYKAISVNIQKFA